MAALDPTPELLAVARRAGTRKWTVGPEGAIEITTNPHLATLVGKGLVRLHYTPAFALADDYWTLTDAGRAWLAEHDKEL